MVVTPPRSAPGGVSGTGRQNSRVTVTRSMNGAWAERWPCGSCVSPSNSGSSSAVRVIVLAPGSRVTGTERFQKLLKWKVVGNRTRCAAAPLTQTSAWRQTGSGLQWVAGACSPLA